MDEYNFEILTNKNMYVLGLLLLNFEKKENNKYYFYFRNKLLSIHILDIFNYIGIITYDKNSINLEINNENIIKNINNNLENDITNLNYIDHISIINNNKNCANSYIRALFEYYGSISHYNDVYSYISYLNKELLELINDIIGIPSVIDKGENLFTLQYIDVNSIDFLGKIYTYTNNLYDEYFYSNYLNTLNSTISLPEIKVLKTNENAVIPSKNRMSDAGYDLTIISLSKSFSSKTKLYDTGIKLDIPNGYYVEIVPRSSLSKSGYMLSNSVGIIDQGYKGNLYVALTKIDSEMPDLVLPFKCCQLLLKKQIYANFIEVSENLADSNRNIGGFGSTNL
jgi:dUTP pyrophosphatase